ncbi:hypothetical protein TWF569_004533 [Orbilia oligospora]|uniref:Aromatic-L-amino-acid decarboxylase n=1 Tax=Orbilia oligospora TaxID=2813651 RepID=A0A7C8NPC7_ORBOL|nr:hypothetical protein TWF102_006071 [Orbilia oligospora]KAF3098572.1 hypothetical protein TWF103_009008 [Orbilia oligospora]KAF3126972.1 hypothetical protein TWF703_010263 [Orbilia oligospora]KAF3144278.1 hypothetical protein TWF594_004810 [Orbilia oligospora]KAF3150657.1 hypothetical protein TWF569_004533 [Orbilia oligospora]
MDSSQFRQAAHAAIDQIVDYYDNIRDRRVLSDVEPGYLRQLLPQGIPETGEKWEDIQKDIEAKIMPGMTHWQSPNFLAFFPSNSSFPGILGDMYSAAFSCAAFNWQCSPAVTELETIVLDNVAKLINLPEEYHSTSEGGGVIHGTASEAIVTVIVAARDRYIARSKERWAEEGFSEDEIEDKVCTLRGRMVALGSDQAHSSTKKGAIIAGVRFQTIETKIGEYALNGELVKQKIEDLESKGLVPFYITVTLGTTPTCATDDFASISATLSTYHTAHPTTPKIWAHIDAAYAGAALVLPEYSHIPSIFPTFADSFDFNMHKWLLTNFDCSCLYVKRRRDLIDALSITPAYLRNEYSDRGLVTDYRDWQIPLGRRFRSLKAWFVTRTFGVEGLRAHIRKGIEGGKAFTQLLEADKERYALVSKPAFALNVFRVNPPPKLAKEVENDKREFERRCNEVTRKVGDRVNKEGKIFITQTVLGKGEEAITAIRVVGGAPAVQVQDLRNAFAIITEVVDRVWEEEVREHEAGAREQVELQAV